MRKLFAALFLLVGVTALSANFAFAAEDSDGRLSPKLIMHDLKSRAAQLGTSAAIDDTTYVGYTPGHSGPNNYWSIYAGTGNEGYMRPVNGQPDKGNWNWDEPVNGDSLQGWWPVRIWSTEAVAGDTDRNRPHTSLDWGNNANYTINEDRGANWQTRANGTEPGWRTFGVDGVWHRDPGGVAGAGSGGAPTWTPIAGTYSAWMGLRKHGDNTVMDPLTGNAFNENVLSYAEGLNAALPGGSDHSFPGYGTSMDQMLYRDIDFASKTTSNLTVSFKYRTNLSTSAVASATARRGWFNLDPLAPTGGAVNPQPNNYISGMDAGLAGQPCDSFMVYVGSGVDGNQWLGSDGNLRDLYDPKHRWFSEVLHADWDPGSDPANPMPLYYKELMSVTGQVGTANDAGTAASFTINNAVLAPFLAKNNKIRLVFRVKTNRGFDDELRNDGFSSSGWGAVQVDDVSYQIGANPVVTFGDFESASAINNDPAVSALDAWKSTGKAPAHYHHVEQYDNVLYEDLCGQKGDARICDLEHGIISVGNHDEPGEPAGGTQLTHAESDWRDAILSPTMQFIDDDANPNTPNPIGLYGIGGNGGVKDIVATDDYYIRYDIYCGIFDGNNGSFFRFAMQAYPAVTPTTLGSTAYNNWGMIQRTGFIFFESTGKLCEQIVVGAAGYGLLRTSNGNGIPDSLRIELEYLQLCYAFGVDVGCSPTDGAYYDNVALAITDGTPSLMQVDIWQWIQDTFPANETPGYPGNAALFDTTAAWIQTGVQISQDTNDLARYSIAGDSIQVQTANNTSRVDMVFRVLPGPGNYNPVGDGHNGFIRRVPSNPATVTPGDGSWWDVLRQNPGEYASPNAATLLQNGKAGWDPNVWISARIDTLDTNIYALQGAGVRGGPANANNWMSTWHESDKRFDLLGILKNRCFVNCETCNLSDIRCDGTVPTYLPGGTLGTTKEFTKIIPDGLLTPGAHVEYFFRAETGAGPVVTLCPDTNVVTPQNLEGPSFDGHRWQEFSVLPDRWKDPQYLHPVFQTFGRGPACLLVIDWNDRRGNERAWVGVADTIGATASEKYGAHNGWHAAGNSSPNNTASFVRVHGGSPGTTWDMYQVKASESIDTATGTIGSRLANRGGDPLVANKSVRNAPTPEMLDAYYTLMLILSGDLAGNLIRPFTNTSDNDAGIIKGWLLAGDSQTQNRGLWVMGDGFVESLQATPPQQDLALNVLKVALVANDFQHTANVSDGTIDLRHFPEYQGKDVAEIYGLRNACLWTTDVINVSTPLLTAITAQYEKKGAPVNGFYGGVFKDWDSNSPYKSLVNSWDIENLVTRNDVNTVGRSAYFYKVFTNVWAKIWNVAGTPVVPLDVPGGLDGDLVNFVNVAGNPMYAQGKAAINFGLAKADRVEVNVYDVGGRLVRKLVDRQYEAGPQVVQWDGLDNGGRAVARGVYFTQVKFINQKYVNALKLTVLK